MAGKQKALINYRRLSKQLIIRKRKTNFKNKFMTIAMKINIFFKFGLNSKL